MLAYLDARKAEGLSASLLFQATIALRHYHRFLLRALRYALSGILDRLDGDGFGCRGGPALF